MKKVILLAMTLPSIVFAGTTAPKEITDLVGKKGSLFSTYNGGVVKDEDGRACEIQVIRSGADDILTISAGLDFAPVILLKDSNVQSSGSTILIVSTENAKRQGGSVCGDGDPLMSYKKIADLQDSTLTIREKYRCLSDLGKSTEVIVGCRIGN